MKERKVEEREEEEEEIEYTMSEGCRARGEVQIGNYESILTFVRGCADEVGEKRGWDLQGLRQLYLARQRSAEVGRE